MKITQSFNKYGYDFKLLKSEEISSQKSGFKRYKAIYIGKSAEVSRDNIEVVILKENLPVELWGETENQIRYPGTSTWGKEGWTFSVLDHAEEKYSKIS